MKKFVLILVMLFTAHLVQAQLLNNEWIDYSKTYYKFKVGTTGLYRINQNALSSNGLGNVPAEQFQLWRNGEQVSLYTSVSTGVLPAGGYIEFWGKRNDGKPDKALYKNGANQLSDALSLETDTASYFLTVNTSGNNFRITDGINDVANNTLAAEPYFLYDYRLDYQQRINWGKPVYFGEYVYSSTYDLGEFWASNEIYPLNPMLLASDSLHLAANGPDASLQVSFVGNSFLGSNRVVKVDINGTNVINSRLNTINAIVFTDTFPLSVISNNAIANFTFTNGNGDLNDRIAVGFVDLKYPRLFDFGSKQNFDFTLPASTQGNYLEISNFKWGNSVAPILYDLTNNKRYTANTAQASILRFALPASAADRKLVLVSEDGTNLNTVSSITKRNFTDYSNGNNQGDYLIISNKILFASGSAVEGYRQYRSSTAGGGFNAKIVDIEEIVDQFAYGIKMHPLSIKNFLKYARSKFAVAPKFVFLIGKAVTYNEFRENENSQFDSKLNLVPTFGWPASDNLLASDDYAPIPATPIGRLAAISPPEVQIYLDKIKTYEQAQQSTVQTIDSKAWMKTMVHVVGANDPSLDYLGSYLNTYRDTIQGPLYGANVTTFSRLTTGPETPLTNALMSQLFNNGISLLNYFGHSAATALDYNLNSPEQFSNYGKYPVFLVNGCNAGNIYSYDTSRLSQITSLSENFVFAKDKGAIAFIASSHFGVANYLDEYNRGFYSSLAGPGYNKGIAINMESAALRLISNRYLDSTTRYLHAEENVLHGDPALKINPHSKPDYVVEDSKVIIDPAFISVADNSFKIKSYFYNIGMALKDSVSILIKRQYPDGSIVTLVDKKIKSLTFIDSVLLTVLINPAKDIGTNKLIVSVDNKNEFDELSELNNTVTKTFEIYQDGLKPIYPYNFSIVNRTNIKLTASTANPLMTLKQYVMQIDTTELFNSPLRYSETITSVGGVLEFNPGISFTDSTVYYWRVAPVASDGNNIWNTSSFVYLPGSSFGYNQSHVYQHLKSSTERIYIDSFSRKWIFTPDSSAIKIINSVFGPLYGIPADFQVQINGATIAASACLGHSVIFNVFDPVTLKPLYNQKIPSTIGSGTYGQFMGSAVTCDGSGKSGTAYNFEFSYLDSTVAGTPAGRRLMRDFLDWVPNGYIVTARIILNDNGGGNFNTQPYVDSWKKDSVYYGKGNTAYDRFINAGFTGFDQYTYPRIWAFIYSKNNVSVSPAWLLSQNINDQITLVKNIATPDTLGYITSPAFGPAAAWKQVKWRGSSLDALPGDFVTVDVVGVSLTGTETTLYTLTSAQQDFDISSVNVAQYPYLKLRMRNADSINLTAYQLRYWRILYDPVPEGALAPNILFTFKDTLNVGEQSPFSIAFKNISDVPFSDSIKVNFTVTDASNVTSILPVSRLKKLNPGDTATITYLMDSKNFNGKNKLFLDVNPDNNQPEQYHFNNILYKDFAVASDDYKPVLDVTFDGIHILNNDIVSSLPHILIKLKDESKFLLLNDTALLKVQLQYPDGSLRRFYFNNDTLRFTPATPGGTENTATVDFTPFFLEDGTYQLIVHGQDQKGNTAGNTDYTVSFQVYNKPMISNMFNYPNPFTTSTAFVFTVTGSVLPQNLRIQVLTITGKIVKEITKEELGPLHIGRNITEYKWDGTDMYGQKLANGVYLYRVITNLNGKQLDKFNTTSGDSQVNTDKYFNKGYGKMYLMR